MMEHLMEASSASRDKSWIVFYLSLSLSLPSMGFFFFLQVLNCCTLIFTVIFITGQVVFDMA